MEPEKEEIKQQSLTVTATSVLGAAINGIIGYIAVYFFKPLWDKLVSWWNSEKNVR
jgi:hypothetical protein